LRWTMARPPARSSARSPPDPVTPNSFRPPFALLTHRAIHLPDVCDTTEREPPGLPGDSAIRDRPSLEISTPETSDGFHITYSLTKTTRLRSSPSFRQMSP